MSNVGTNGSAPPFDQARSTSTAALVDRCGGLGIVGGNGDSSSSTSMLAIPLVNPGAAAVTLTTCVPSTSDSSTTVRSNRAWNAPAATTTLAGTFNAVASDELSVTTR